MERTIRERTEAAYHLCVDLDTSVSHFEQALFLMMRGEFVDAHWELWRAGLTKEVPWEQMPMTTEAA